MMKDTASGKHDVTPETRRGIVKGIIQAALGLVGYGLILFLAAGTLNWLWGWVFLGMLAAFMAAHPLILVPINPELLAEREKGLWDRRVKPWDRWVAALAAGVMPAASWVVAGLDFRFHWTEPVPLVYHLGGLLASVLGYALFLWAMASNAFFAEGVRIQEERGHVVATGGPYRYLRHPGYAGAILAQLATPFLLGSAWAMIPSVASAALYVVRTHLEDRTLVEELPGYEDFAQQTRYRLVPGVWWLLGGPPAGSGGRVGEALSASAGAVHRLWESSTWAPRCPARAPCSPLARQWEPHAINEVAVISSETLQRSNKSGSLRPGAEADRLVARFAQSRRTGWRRRQEFTWT